MSARPSYPDVALSVRQPWAWLILHGGKDIENRTWTTRHRGPTAIHASQGMTRAEYENAVFSVEHQVDPTLADAIPPAHELERGGIVGAVEIVGCVDESDSQWFSGPFGFVMQNRTPLDFVPCRGALKMFRWEPLAPAAGEQTRIKKAYEQATEATT